MCVSGFKILQGGPVKPLYEALKSRPKFQCQGQDLEISEPQDTEERVAWSLLRERLCSKGDIT